MKSLLEQNVEKGFNLKQYEKDLSTINSSNNPDKYALFSLEYSYLHGVKGVMERNILINNLFFDLKEMISNELDLLRSVEHFSSNNRALTRSEVLNTLMDEKRELKDCGSCWTIIGVDHASNLVCNELESEGLIVEQKGFPRVFNLSSEYRNKVLLAKAMNEAFGK